MEEEIKKKLTELSHLMYENVPYDGIHWELFSKLSNELSELLEKKTKLNG